MSSTDGIDVSSARCSACGEPAGPDARFCTSCGAPLGAHEPAPNPPGWYADPFEHATYRWWDGSKWTWQVTEDRRVVSWDAIPTETPSPRPEGVRGVGVAIAGLAIGLAASLAGQGLLALFGHPGGTTTRLWVGQSGLWLGLVGACVFVSRRRGTGSFARDFGLRFRWIDLGLGLAGAFAGRLLAISAVQPIAVFIRHASRPDERQLHRFTHGNVGWASIVVVACVGAPLFEELFFRGLVQTRLVTRWGPVLGIAVTSLFFGAVHLVGWVGPITLAYAWAVAAGGLALGAIRHLTGRLGTSMFAHAIFNAQAILALALLTRAR